MSDLVTGVPHLKNNIKIELHSESLWSENIAGYIVEMFYISFQSADYVGGNKKGLENKGNLSFTSSVLPLCVTMFGNKVFDGGD